MEKYDPNYKFFVKAMRYRMDVDEKMSQQDLAKIIGVKPGHISGVMGKRVKFCRPDIQEKIAKALGFESVEIMVNFGSGLEKNNPMPDRTRGRPITLDSNQTSRITRIMQKIMRISDSKEHESMDLIERTVEREEKLLQTKETEPSEPDFSVKRGSGTLG